MTLTIMCKFCVEGRLIVLIFISSSALYLVSSEAYLDCQFTLPVNSREAKDIGHAVKRQTWDSNDLVRDISNVQIKKVDNRCLERGYHEKRSALREKGRTPKELTEQLAFTVETDEYRVNAICRDGLKCTGIDHTLGDGGMGVTVWRCPDLCLKGLNWPASESAFLLVFKIVKGRVKSVPCKPSPGIPNLEPTPNHDCHMARNTLDSSATDLNLLLRITQYYLYEYDDEGLPVKRPRQCLPFAVISLNKNDLPRVPSPARPLMFTPLTSGRHFKEHAEDLRSPPCNEKGGILVWRGLVTSRNKSLGRVSLFSGHRLGFNIWKSYLDVSKKMPLRQLTELLPRDLKCAWKSPLLYRNHTLSICTMKVAQDQPTETLTSFNRRLVTKAKSAGVLCIDKTTTMLIISCKLAKFLGLCDSGMPAEIFCIVCRRKTTPFFSSSYSNNLPSQQCDTCGLLDGSTAFIQSSLHLNSRHSAKIVVSLPETSLLPSSQYRSPRKGVKRSLSFSHIPCRGVDASNSGGRTYRSASCCEKRSSKRETSPAEVFINEKILRNSDPGVDKADALVIENRSINETIPSCSDSTLSVEAFQAPNSNWAANDNTIENLKRFVCNTVNFKEPLSDLRSGDFSKLESEIQTTQSSQATKLEATCIPLADFRDTEIRHLQEPHLGTLNLQQRQTFKSAKLESMYNPLGDFQDVNTISSSNSMSERKESCETQMESSVKLPTTEHAKQQTNSTGDDLPLSSAILVQDITLPLTPTSVPTEVKYSHLTSGKSSTPSIDYERSCGKCSLNSIDEKYSRNYENENEKVTMKHSSALSTSAMYGVTAIQASFTLHSAQDKSKDSSCATDTITFSSSDKEQFDNSVLVSSQLQSSSGNKAMISIQPTSPFNAQDMSSSETVESKREIENYIPSLPTATDVERDVAACEQLDADVLPSFSFMYSMKSHKVCIDRLRLLQDALKAPRKGSGFDANSKARNPRPVRDSFCKEDSTSSVKTKEDPFGLNLESTEGTSAKESMADSSKNTLHTSQTSSQRDIVLDKQSWPCQGGAIEMSLNKDWGFSASVDDHRAKHELKSCEDSLCCSDGLASTDGDGPAEKLSLPMGIETKAVECGPQDQLKAHTVRKRVESCDNAEDVGARKGIEPDGKGGGSCGLVEEQGRDFISKMEPCSRLSSNAKLSSDRFEFEESSQGECCTNEMAEIEPETTESIAVEPKRVLSQTVKVKEEVSPVKVLLHEIELKRDDFEALNNRKRPANASSSFMESLLSNKTKVDTHQEKQLMADVAVVVGKHSEMNQKKNQRRLENEGELFKRRRNATIYQSRRRAESLSLPPRAPPPPLAYFNTGWKRGREVLVNDTRGIGLRRYHSENVRFNNQFPIPYVDNAMNWELLRTGGNQRCYPYCNDLLPLHNRRMNHLWHCLMLDGLRWLPWR